MNLGDFFYRGLKLISRKYDTTRYFSKGYRFLDNMQGSEYLVLIVAGYQEYVWSKVFGRIKNALPENYDVCIVSPGIYRDELEKLCVNYKWSYLFCKQNKLAQAQNTAIKLHTGAKFIHKLDEDIFIGKTYFEDLEKVYQKALRDNIYKVGMVCPLLNVNGAAYRFFLKEKGILSVYEDIFGTARITCDDDAIYLNGNAAKYIWENTLPIDNTVEFFKNLEVGYFPAAVRFSIGAIFFSREFWEKAGYFKVAAEGQLAWEELEICNFCFNRSFSILIATNVFAGHLGFGKQKKIMKDFYLNNEEDF